MEPNEKELKIMRTIEFQTWDHGYMMFISIFTTGLIIASAIWMLGGFLIWENIYAGLAILGSLVTLGTYYFFINMMDKKYEKIRFRLWGIREGVKFNDKR